MHNHTFAEAAQMEPETVAEKMARVFWSGAQFGGFFGYMAGAASVLLIVTFVA